MVMYSLNGSYPVATMPHRVRRINGLTYTSEAVYGCIDDESHPWIAVSDPPDYDAATHSLSWSGVDWVVTENPPVVIVEQPVEVTEEPVEVAAPEELTETVADATAPAEVVSVDAEDTIDGDANG